jgi:hypothetical protein
LSAPDIACRGQTMIHDITAEQISRLEIVPHRPLVICDVDEVIVHFTREFEEFLDARGMALDFDTHVHGFALSKYKHNHQPLSRDETFKNVDQFFAERTLGMKTIDGAVDGLKNIARHAEVVMLTNLPHHAGDDRRKNLESHGLNFPVVTNSGPKGPAIHRIASQVLAPVVFIDDSPGFITSAFEYAPDIHLIHFVHDERFLRISKPLDFVSLSTDNWIDLHLHVLDIIAPS